MIEYYISSTKYNLQERMTKRGKVYDLFFYVVTLDGEQKQKRISGFANKTLAKNAYTDFVTSKCELVKNNPIRKKNVKKEELLVGDLLRQYLTTLSNQNKDSSIYEKKNIYRLFIIDRFDKMPARLLTREELYKWQDELWATRNKRTGEYFSHPYLLKVRGLFGAFLSWVESRYGIKNYLPEVVKPKRRAPKTQMKIWTREDFDKFIAVVDNPMYHALFTMLFFTGRRKGELFSLTNADIKPTTILFNKSLTRKTLDNNPYKITSTKADKVQTTPICKIVQDELKTYKGESPFFFGGEKPLAEMTVARKFKAYCKQADLPIIRIHDLRHSFVSMLIHLGANFMVVADLIGDTVEQVTKTYGHMYESDKLEIVGKII